LSPPEPPGPPVTPPIPPERPPPGPPPVAPPGPPEVPPTSAVPEPATWAMMIIGFFGLGASIRSNRARAALSRTA
jgi:hypothetical protein